MTTFKEKLQLLLSVLRVILYIPALFFGSLFVIIWTLSGLEEGVVNRLGIATLVSLVPAVGLTLQWLFTGNKEDQK